MEKWTAHWCYLDGDKFLEVWEWSLPGIQRTWRMNQYISMSDSKTHLHPPSAQKAQVQVQFSWATMESFLSTWSNRLNSSSKRNTWGYKRGYEHTNTECTVVWKQEEGIANLQAGYGNYRTYGNSMVCVHNEISPTKVCFTQFQNPM